ncbi:Hypothetical predicted protein [Lynx pardinus]|uniref:Uncharacterized protein n=1 Tax=Lynx pardinus TaxID=191816 RepID=A0A485NUB1_LYNPA|nr:Hypothetical predicted protein [Lynx pardinus]
MPGSTSSKLEARSLPLTSCWPWTPPRAVWHSLALWSTQGPSGLAKPQETCTATPNPTCGRRAGSLSTPEATGPAGLQK